MFNERTIGEFEVLEWRPWAQQGFVHGFIGTSGFFAGDALYSDVARLTASLGGTVSLCRLNQTHSKDCILVSATSLPEPTASNIGDAWVLTEPVPGRGFLVSTADCLPLIMRIGDRTALVHAGWRGLADGIIAAALDLLVREYSAVRHLEVVIGPAAGFATYQVGSEVPEAIGPAAATREVDGKLFLSLVATAENQIMNWSSQENFQAVVHDSGICSIVSDKYHSRRRCGDSRGSNVAFVLG